MNLRLKLLGINLCYYRRIHGLSQKQLSESLDLKPTTYSGYERGRSEPTINTLIKIADFYGLTLDELVRGG